MCYSLMSCEPLPLQENPNASEYNELVFISNKDTSVCTMLFGELTIYDAYYADYDSVYWEFPVYPSEQTETISSNEAIFFWYVDSGTVRLNRFLNGIRTSVDVQVFDCLQTIYIPSSFTPNGDGKNDLWQPIYRNIYEMDWKVFSEDGVEIFHSEGDLNARWDGNWNNHPAPVGLYQYDMTYRTIHPGDQRRTSGWIELYRWE